MSIKHKTPHIKKMFYLPKDLCEWLRFKSFSQDIAQSEIIVELLGKQIQNEREQENERTFNQEHLQGVKEG